MTSNQFIVYREKKHLLIVQNMFKLEKTFRRSPMSHVRDGQAQFISVPPLIILVVVACNQLALAETKTTIPDASKMFLSPKAADVDSNEINDLRNKCIYAEHDLDKCSAQLIALNEKGMHYPTNMEELNSVYCMEFKRAVSCVKNSTSCFKPFERQIINWVLTSTRKMNHKRCKNENEKHKFLRLSNSCFQKMRSPMDSCMNNYIGSLDAISESYSRNVRLDDDDIQIQLACCANRRFKDCVMKNAKKMCRPYESLRKLKRTNSVSSQRVAHKYIQKDMQEMMEDLKLTMDGMTLTGPELICQKIEEKFCEAEFNHKFNNRVAKHMSIVPAMIKIYSNK